MGSIDAISGLGQRPFPPDLTGGSAAPKTGFGETLGDMLQDINSTLKEAGKGAEKMANGEVADIAEVMVAAEKASVGLELVVEIRNRLLDSYKEILRTQI